MLDAYRARLTVRHGRCARCQPAGGAGRRLSRHPAPRWESQFRQEVIALAILVGQAPEAISLGEVHLTRSDPAAGGTRPARRQSCAAAPMSPMPRRS